MPWRPLLEICREFERLPVRLDPAATKELKLFFANRLNLAVDQISDDDISTVTKFTTLQRPDVAMVHAARETMWLASGRRSADGNREVIPPGRWAFLTLDIEHQAARDFNGKVIYADLKGAFGNDLTEEEWQSVELQLAPPSPAPDWKSGATAPTAGAHQPDAETPETPETRREKRARETQEQYARWYSLAHDVRREGKWKRPTDIARAVAKREKNATAKNVKRRLDERFPGWATEELAQKAGKK